MAFVSLSSSIEILPSSNPQVSEAAIKKFPLHRQDHAMSCNLPLPVARWALSSSEFGGE